MNSSLPARARMLTRGPAVPSPAVHPPARDQSAGEDESGGGSSGDAAGAPGPPPGPSGYELDLLKDYGDNARRRIRMLARTPERAREQKLKGKVKFQFEVSKTGKLLSVKVLDSSGHPVLDEECLEATKVAAPFGRFPRDVKVESWKFEMTLEFPLV
jgi:TonB family protein